MFSNRKIIVVHHNRNSAVYINYSNLECVLNDYGGILSFLSCVYTSNDHSHQKASPGITAPVKGKERKGRVFI